MEIGNLPKKELRVMIVKMIQDLGKRMEAQTEKIQEMLERARRSKEQTEMNNTITEMKNTLEGINSRKNEAEEWISELEDRMVEITATEQNKEKRMKMRTVTENSGTILNTPTFALYGPQKEKRERT